MNGKYLEAIVNVKVRLSLFTPWKQTWEVKESVVPIE